LPSREEWQTLIDYAGGSSVAGKKLRAKSGWNDYKSQSGNGTDDYGFSALPGGCWSPDAKLRFTRTAGFWWTATEHHGNGASYVSMSNIDINIVLLSRCFKSDIGFVKAESFSVRCVKDN
jgi:uncharacterized protein (TIGR02145 family)